MIQYQRADFEVRFAAHLAIVLILHDRIDPIYQDKYNVIIANFIESIVESKVKIDVATKVKRIPFYIAMMIGDQAQRENYAKVLLYIS